MRSDSPLPPAEPFAASSPSTPTGSCSTSPQSAVHQEILSSTSSPPSSISSSPFTTTCAADAASPRSSPQPCQQKSCYFPSKTLHQPRGRAGCMGLTKIPLPPVKTRPTDTGAGAKIAAVTPGSGLQHSDSRIPGVPGPDVCQPRGRNGVLGATRIPLPRPK